jgi:DNA-binding XRE family transcriptional regulator
MIDCCAKKEIMQRFGAYLADMDMTEKALADKVGIAQSTIASYKKGDRLPNLITFAQICAVLKISAAEILGLEA